MKIRFFLAAFVVFLLFMLSGCNDKTKDFIITEFESNISLQNEKTEIQGVLRFRNKENILFTVTSPENLKDITVSFNGKETIVSAAELSVSMENISLGEDLFTPLFECICLLSSSNNIIGTEGTDELIISGKNGEFTVNANCDEEKILSIQNKEKIYKFG